MGLTFKKLGVSFFGLVSFSLTKHFDPIVRLFICLPGFIYGCFGLAHTHPIYELYLYFRGFGSLGPHRTHIGYVT